MGLIISIAILISTIIIVRGQRQVQLTQPMQPMQPALTPEILPEILPLRSSTVPVSPHADLTQLIEAIYDAAMKAQSNVQINNLHNFLWLFPKDDAGTHTCRTIPINMGDDKIMEVPVFSLLHHQNLSIHDLKIKTTLDIQMPTEPEVLDEILNIKNKKYSVKVNRTKNDKRENTTIELSLKAQEPTEMYHRMFEKYNLSF